jgi:TolB protein
MVHRAHSGGPFNIAFQHLERGTIKILTETALDESPTVAPNGSMIMYATRWRGKGILAAVSIDGNVKYHLPSAFRDVREPAWSPALK